MIKPPIIREPFLHTDVAEIVTEEVPKGTEGLKERVTAQVIFIIGINDGKLPERIRTWVHQLCLPHTSGLGEPIFSGKLALPIDIASLPNR